MLLLTGPSWPEFDFIGNGNGFFINNKRLLLSPVEEMEGDHALRTSTTIWDGSIILSKYLENHQQSLQLNQSVVVELGAGRGIAGISCGLMGSKCIITDLPDVIHGLEKSIQLSQVDAIAYPLDWTNPQIPKQEFDYIIAADVIWLQDLIIPLVDTIDALLSPKTIMFLCHQTRSELTDKKLFDELQKRGLLCTLVPQDQLDCYYCKPKIHLYKISRKV